MLMLKIIGVILIIITILTLIIKYENYCMENFNCKNFTLISLIPFGVAFIFYAIGKEWYYSPNSDPLNGIILFILALIIVIWRIYYNCKQTNILHGLIATIFQALFFWFGIIFIFGKIFESFGSEKITIYRNGTKEDIKIIR